MKWRAKWLSLGNQTITYEYTYDYRTPYSAGCIVCGFTLRQSCPWCNIRYWSGHSCVRIRDEARNTSYRCYLYYYRCGYLRRNPSGIGRYGLDDPDRGEDAPKASRKHHIPGPYNHFLPHRSGGNRPCGLYADAYYLRYSPQEEYPSRKALCRGFNCFTGGNHLLADRSRCCGFRNHFQRQRLHGFDTSGSDDHHPGLPLRTCMRFPLLISQRKRPGQGS